MHPDSRPSLLGRACNFDDRREILAGRARLHKTLGSRLLKLSFVLCRFRISSLIPTSSSIMHFQSWALTALSATGLLLDGAAASTRAGHKRFVERSHRRQEMAKREVEKTREAERRALEARQANCTENYRFYSADTARKCQPLFHHAVASC